MAESVGQKGKVTASRPGTGKSRAGGASGRHTSSTQISTVRNLTDSGTGPVGERPGQQAQWLTTRLDSVLDWARGNSLWPLPFGTACCAIEFMSSVSSHYDLARFGAEVVRFSPRQADLMIVAGTVVDKMGPVLRTIYEQMPNPKWVIAMGACASSGGMFRSYPVMQGIDHIVPVDFYIPGCPPRPEAVMDGLMKLQARVQEERVPADGRHREISELTLPVVEKRIA